MAHLISRRQFARAAGLLTAGAFVGTAFRAQAAGAEFQLGLATVSFSKYTPEEIIKLAKSLDLHNVSLFGTHCPWTGTAEQCRVAAQKFKDAGLKITGSGVINLPNNEDTVRRAFENAKAVGLPTMVCKPSLNAYPLVEKFVKEYDQILAVHNHGPGDKEYPSPLDAWKAVEPYDKRIGICIDVGHCYRAGTNPAEAVRKCRTRLYDIHMKDSAADVGATKDIPMPVGKGKMDIKGILAALNEIKYSRIVAFEYEKGGPDAVAGLNESVEFVRKNLG
jgi:inosose dehydratase